MIRNSLRARTRSKPYIGRLVRANVYDLWLLLNESWLVLIAFFVLAALTSSYLAFLYPETAESSRPQGLPEALYETLTLMTLQSDLAFPRGDLLGELIFFLTPLLGLALIFQSVLNFGRLLLDKGSRREAWQVALASTYRDRDCLWAWARRAAHCHAVARCRVRGSCDRARLEQRVCAACAQPGRPDCAW
jgi:hypothetical protein